MSVCQGSGGAVLSHSYCFFDDLVGQIFSSAQYKLCAVAVHGRHEYLDSVSFGIIDLCVRQQTLQQVTERRNSH